MDLQSHSSVGPLGVFLEFVELGHRHEFAVRIEGGQHPFHRAMDEILIGQGFAIDVIFADPLQNPGEKFELLIRIIPFVRGAELEELGPEADIGHEGGDEEGIDQTFVHLSDSDALLRATNLDSSFKKGRGLLVLFTGVLLALGGSPASLCDYADGRARFGLGRTQPGRNLLN